MLTILAAAALLQGGGGNTEDAVLVSLKYLSRHQAEDGSWGGPVDRCTCPWTLSLPPVARDPAVERKCLPLIAALDDDLLEVRDRAMYDLLAIGLPAVPFLQDAVREASGEGPARAMLVLRKIELASRKPDLEATALALLAFLGAGYSHLSKDTHGGICFGTVVRAGLAWISEKQGPLMESISAIDPAKADPRLREVAALALFVMDIRHGAFWRKWSGPLKDALVPSQNADGCARGSWPGSDSPLRVTALNTLALETRYRYGNVPRVK